MINLWFSLCPMLRCTSNKCKARPRCNWGHTYKYGKERRGWATMLSRNSLNKGSILSRHQQHVIHIYNTIHAKIQLTTGKRITYTQFDYINYSTLVFITTFKSFRGSQILSSLVLQFFSNATLVNEHQFG